MSGGIEMDRVSYRAPGADRALIDGVSFGCESGDAIAISGAVGAGKTTLLHLLAALIRPDEGEVRADGRAVSRFIAPHRDRWRREVGLVFQTLHLLEDRKVFENVLMPLLPLKMGAAKRKEKTAVAMDAVGISALASQTVSTLSGGERQKTAIARALVSTPRFLLLDEPTAHLDTAGTALVLRLLGTATERGASVVVVSHDPRLLENAVFGRRYRLESGALSPLSP